MKLLGLGLAFVASFSLAYLAMFSLLVPERTARLLISQGLLAVAVVLAAIGAWYAYQRDSRPLNREGEETRSPTEGR